MAYSALVVEDEPLARQTLRAFIGEAEWLQCVGEARNGNEAVRLIDQTLPDVVFLDIKIPELSGLEVLERVHHQPVVVFTTAYDEYAVSAFELEAVDYLVKPFGRKRFRNALTRVLSKLNTLDNREHHSVAHPELNSRKLDRFFVRKGQQMLPIQSVSIVRIEACGDYAAIHVGGESYLVHLTLEELTVRLHSDRFRRVHRSHVINLDHVTSMRPHDPRRLLITLTDGSQILASRHGSRALHELVP